MGRAIGLVKFTRLHRQKDMRNRALRYDIPSTTILEVLLHLRIGSKGPVLIVKPRARQRSGTFTYASMMTALRMNPGPLLELYPAKGLQLL